MERHGNTFLVALASRGEPSTSEIALLLGSIESPQDTVDERLAKIADLRDLTRALTVRAGLDAVADGELTALEASRLLRVAPSAMDTWLKRAKLTGGQMRLPGVLTA